MGAALAGAVGVAPNFSKNAGMFSPRGSSRRQAADGLEQAGEIAIGEASS